MSFATLLVHVEADSSSDPRLALAVDLSNQLEAKLIGVAAEFYRPTYYGFDVGAGDLMAAEMEAVEIDLKRAQEKFQSIAGSVRNGSEWRAAIQFPLTDIAAEARAADLVITSSSARARASDYRVARPGALILQTGRPVLVSPPDMTRLNVTNALVAWKDTREARRAVLDALPLLQRAQTVALVEICDNSDAASAATARLSDVAKHLLRHDIRASFSVGVDELDRTAARYLLEIAARHNVDLIVAGAYGHSRFQEWVFGGVTQALLSQTERAVLFSH